jgi:nitroreductase
MLRDLVEKNRSYRRWHQSEAIPHETLVDFIDLARLCPSASNQQGLKYIISDDPETNALIFPYLKIDNDPVEGERAAAYIVIVHDKNFGGWTLVDLGIVAQTIMLAATENGYGGVMIGLVNRTGLHEALGLPENFDVKLVLAIGKTIETVIVEPQTPGSVEYQWWETKDIRHVPKRSLEEILVKYPKKKD